MNGIAGKWTMRALYVIVIVALIVAVSSLFTSCLQPRYEIQTSNVAPAASLVLTRVERYADADATIGEPERAAVLADVSSVRILLGQPATDQRLLAPPLTRVCDRHDAWVAVDIALDPTARTIYLETTARLRAVLQPPP